MDDGIKEVLCSALFLSILAVSIILSIAIPCLISEKRNIEKELKMKEIEIYGEYRENGGNVNE